MNENLKLVAAHFDEKQISYTLDEEAGALRIMIPTENSVWRIVYHVNDEACPLLSVLGLCPVLVPEHRRRACAELLTRLNWKFKMGGFEMDFTDGEIRFRLAAPIAGGVVTPDMLVEMTAATLGCCDYAFPSIAAVLFANRDPAEALASVEGKSTVESPEGALRLN